jgi:hypothetical protein
MSLHQATIVIALQLVCEATIVERSCESAEPHGVEPFCQLAGGVDRRESVPRRQRNDQAAMRDVWWST